MLKLTEAELDAGFAAIEQHGYGDFFPLPPEWTVVKAHWPDIRTELVKHDLDMYTGYDVLRSFAPKSRLNVRRVALLHPYDLILFTSLVHALRNGISAARLPAIEERVFSYRADGAAAGLLYNEEPHYGDFKEKIAERVHNDPECFVGITDIADFYPRIYQHRLVNALQAAIPGMPDHIRVLEKMLSRFSEDVSYGIPIGPPAARLLGEAVLIDVDSTLLSYDIDFIRFTDDYVIFASAPEEAEFAIRILAETLFLNHGLTLQTAKTRVLKASEYLENYLIAADEKEEARRKLIDLVGDYDDAVSYEDLDEDQKREIDALNLSEMLTEALAEGHNVDFKEVSFVLGRLSALEKPELIPIVLDNLERLLPVAHSVAAFFKKFENLDAATREEVAGSLLGQILDDRHSSEYYAVWILSIFQHHSHWNHADQLLRVFRETSSDAVRRAAVLALASCGTRAQVLHVKQYLQTASSLSRTAMMLATKKMGTDERKYLRASLKLQDSFERLCMSS